MGNNFALVVDGEQKSNRGLLRRVGGFGPWSGFMGTYPLGLGSGGGKLSSYRLPCWSRGYGNIKVQYSAGYHEDSIPADLQFAATTLSAFMLSTQPKGLPLQSESLGAYSYSVLTGSEVPEIGTVRGILTRYREVSW